MSTVPPVTSPRVAPKRLVKRRWPRWLAWSLGVFLVVGLVGVWRTRASQQTSVSVQTTTVQRGTVRDFVTSVSAGRVAGKQETSLRADIAGKIRVLYKHRGDAVAANEPILEYDSDELRERLRLANVSVDIARAQSKQVEQNSATAETNYARAQRLKESGSIAPAELENLEGQSKALARAVDASHASISQALANVELAKTALGKSIVRAPFAGTVMSTSVEVGEVTVPGGPIAEFADISTLHVDAELDEADLGRVKLGMPADVTLDAFPGERIRGTLTEIAPSVTRDLRGGRSVAIDVALPQDPRLRVGMSADVDVIVASLDHVLFVPPNAVVGRGTDRSAYLVKDGVVQKRSLDVGVATWEAVEIRGGLAEGDAVVSSLSTAKLVDGTRVEVTKTGGK